MELTIEITGWCDRNCPNCSSNASHDGKDLDFDTITQFIWEQCTHHIVNRINISGGEPLHHPRFFDILKYCIDMVGEKGVYVYSTYIRNLAFNASIIDHVNVHANACLAPDSTIHIPTCSYTLHLMKFIPQGRGHDIQPIDVHVSQNLVNADHCKDCKHLVLRADGVTVKAPCKKEVEVDKTTYYGEKEKCS